MKLSEEIVLGSTLIKFEPSVYLVRNCGCLLGMAGAALGKDKLIKDGELLFPEHPWLFDKFKAPLELSMLGEYPAFTIIGEMARQIKDGTYTFEQALAWIESVEPEEERLPDYVEKFLTSPDYGCESNE